MARSTNGSPGTAGSVTTSRTLRVSAQCYLRWMADGQLWQAAMTITASDYLLGLLAVARHFIG